MPPHFLLRMPTQVTTPSQVPHQNHTAAVLVVSHLFTMEIQETAGSGAEQSPCGFGLRLGSLVAWTENPGQRSSGLRIEFLECINSHFFSLRSNHGSRTFSSESCVGW